MLITKNDTQLKDNEIYGIKLVTGEDILAKVVSSDEHTVRTEEPHVMMIGTNAQGQHTAQFVPLLPMLAKDSDPVLERSSIVATYKPDTAFLEAYSQTVSDLILPSQRIQT